MNHSNTDKTERGHSMLFYTAVLELLESYFPIPGWKKLFLTGGCFWLSDYLHRGICPSVLMINRTEEHCALYFAHGLYDVTGKISEKNFHEAAKRVYSNGLFTCRNKAESLPYEQSQFVNNHQFLT